MLFCWEGQSYSTIEVHFLVTLENKVILLTCFKHNVNKVLIA